MRQRASTDGWPTAQRTGISGSKTKWPVYTRRFAESSTGVDNWAIRRQLTEKRPLLTLAGTDPARSCGACHRLRPVGRRSGHWESHVIFARRNALTTRSEEHTSEL